jgi:hypothetical protein
MSTLFGIFKSGGHIILEDDCLPSCYKDEEFEIVAFRGNGTGMRWENDLAKYLPSNTRVYPLDNSAQGIYTIGDIIAEIDSQT